jgi:hypothetical protein
MNHRISIAAVFAVTVLRGTSTYNKGSGVSRSASCKDAAGNTVTCFSR